MASQALAAPLHGAPVTLEHLTPAVLVVDDDRECVSLCARMLEDLNYRHHCATSARQALELLSRDPAIQILLVDMQIPAMDGCVLIEEARARVGGGRPLAAVMLTEKLSTDLAIKGLHVEAVDLLCKPLGFDAYSGALRRAMRYLGARREIADGASMTNFSQQLARLVSVLEGKTLDTRADVQLTDKEISATLRAIIASRALRNRFFPSQMFADPAWDILLDLTRAKLDGQQVSVSSVCIAASVPMSTALRWVRQMTEAGLLRRWTDPKDRRRDLIALTDTTAAHMRDYLAAVHGMLSKL
ncbi:response regulator transcription factor [Novosphingobium album (ex Liu et al. 2023)]|uniref:Response regulator transcription factor n=1 Tax=Novosphingobium album (ex Liu et al. 2023) TaxID=3031130 RepID=A0ABT5WPY7_9SPHN|nr:response regulator transcription factor [Novosphingobium album (ex Liu et al. 2023)]MDE8651821.1 response regulator transcription factor [Novosphingobium album (ex Liu et al. 2023)]